MSPRERQTREPSSFLKFPAEIRSPIWHHIVVKEDAPVRVYSRKRQRSAANLLASLAGPLIQYRPKDDYLRVKSKLAIAFVCRQFYLEVTPIYYSRNIFLFGSINANGVSSGIWENFSAAIGSERAKFIVSISMSPGLKPPIAQRLALFPSLKRIHLGGLVSTYQPCREPKNTRHEWQFSLVPGVFIPTQCSVCTVPRLWSMN